MHSIEPIWCLLLVFHVLELLVFLHAFKWDTEQLPALPCIFVQDFPWRIYITKHSTSSDSRVDFQLWPKAEHNLNHIKFDDTTLNVFIEDSVTSCIYKPPRHPDKCW